MASILLIEDSPTDTAVLTQLLEQTIDTGNLFAHAGRS